MSTTPKPLPYALPIVGAACCGPEHEDWRALARALRAAQPLGGHHALLPVVTDANLRRQRKRMSHSAYMATLTLGKLIESMGWQTCAIELGYYLGVGASGGDMGQLHDLLEYSRVDGAFDVARFGQEGLLASNPLFAFQLMNNFTMCHGAVIHGVGGPNAAIFGHGVGTTCALEEAAWSILDGHCERAIAGGADSAVYPVTAAELERTYVNLPPLSEGVGLLALASPSTPEATRAIGALHEVYTLNDREHEAMMARVEHSPAHLIICHELITGRWSINHQAQPAPMPCALAASPAWSWLIALELLGDGLVEEVTVCARGEEEAWGVATFGRWTDAR